MEARSEVSGLEMWSNGVAWFLEEQMIMAVPSGGRRSQAIPEQNGGRWFAFCEDRFTGAWHGQLTKVVHMRLVPGSFPFVGISIA